MLSELQTVGLDLSGRSSAPYSASTEQLMAEADYKWRASAGSLLVSSRAPSRRL